MRIPEENVSSQRTRKIYKLWDRGPIKSIMASHSGQEDHNLFIYDKEYCEFL